MALHTQEIMDETVWNQFVIQNNPWSLFQSWQWGEVQIEQNNKVWRLGLFDDTKLIGIAQTILVKAKRGHFLHVRHGPIFIKDPITDSEKYWQIFINHLKKISNQENVWFIRVSPMIDDSPANNYLLKQLGFRPSPIHAMDGEYCWVLDIDKDEDELLKNMRKTTRYLVRQAEKLQVQVKETNNIDSFLNLYNQTAKRHGFVPHKGILEEYRVFKKNNSTFLLFASHKEKLLAASLILLFADQAVYHHGASISTKIPASYLLQWQAIKETKRRGAKIYNFWGIAPPESPRHPWKGISLFKQGFGGRFVKFVHAHDLSLSPFYTISYTIETLRKILKGY